MSPGRKVLSPSIYENESVFGQLGEPHRFPEVSRVRETLRRWRFYHEFAIGRHSPLRQPAVGYRSPVLDSDGQNLAAAFQTIVEIGAEEILHEILADAFPGCQFYCENEHSRFALKMRREGSAARCWRRRCPTVRCAFVPRRRAAQSAPAGVSGDQ